MGRTGLDQRHVGAERTWESRPLPGWPQAGIVPAWAYQPVVAVPDAAASWALPLHVQRRGPTAKSAAQVALDQIAKMREAQGADAPPSDDDARQRV